ncbi:hypothetical protein Pen01_77410 [Phytomonospora endophytica]|nr:hypothetical protein Pen01_77410 [Phytomonospora endophytica]
MPEAGPGVKPDGPNPITLCASAPTCGDPLVGALTWGRESGSLSPGRHFP